MAGLVGMDGNGFAGLQGDCCNRAADLIWRTACRVEASHEFQPRGLTTVAWVGGRLVNQRRRCKQRRATRVGRHCRVP